MATKAMIFELWKKSNKCCLNGARVLNKKIFDRLSTEKTLVISIWPFLVDLTKVFFVALKTYQIALLKPWFQ